MLVVAAYRQMCALKMNIESGYPISWRSVNQECHRFVVYIFF